MFYTDWAIILIGWIIIVIDERKVFKRECHAELVSAPHRTSGLLMVDLACGIPKQVRNDG
jgi:hypothetical protein